MTTINFRQLSETISVMLLTNNYETFEVQSCVNGAVYILYTGDCIIDAAFEIARAEQVYG